MRRAFNTGASGPSATAAAPSTNPASAASANDHAIQPEERRHARVPATTPTPSTSAGAIATATEFIPANSAGSGVSIVIGTDWADDVPEPTCPGIVVANVPQHRQRGNWRTVVSAALAATSALAATGPAAAGPSGDLPVVELHWTAPDRTEFTVQVAEEDFATFLRRRAPMLAAEGERVAGIADMGLAAESGPVLNALLMRVPDYIDWVYGWIDGYVAAFRVIGRTAQSLSTGPSDSGPLASFSDAMRHVANAELERLVVEPVQPDDRIGAVLARLDAILADEWRRILDRDQSRWLDLLRAHAGSARRASKGTYPGASGCAAPPPIASGAELDTSALAEAAVGEQTELYVWRVTRPFATRLGALATRLAIGGASLTGGGIMGLGGFGAGGAAIASFAATSGAVWSVDYGLNLLDDVLHRDLLSAQVTERLVAAMEVQEQRLSVHARTRIDAAVAELSRCRDRSRPKVAHLP